MTSIKRNKVLLDQTTAGDGEWIRLDSRYDCDSFRTLQVNMSVGDTITIQGTTVDVRGANPADVIASLTPEDISDLQVFTDSGTGDLLAGPWSYIRAVKVGATGSAKVQGYV